MKSFKDYMLDEAANKKKAPKISAKEKARRAEMDKREPGETDDSRNRVSSADSHHNASAMGEDYRKTRSELDVYRKNAMGAVDLAWKKGQMTDDDAKAAKGSVKNGLLPGIQKALNVKAKTDAAKAVSEENIEETMDEPGPTRYRETARVMIGFNKAIASDNKKYGTNPDTKANDKKRAIGLQKKVTSIGKTHDNSASVQRNRKELERLKAKAAARKTTSEEVEDKREDPENSEYYRKRREARGGKVHPEPAGISKQHVAEPSAAEKARRAASENSPEARAARMKAKADWDAKKKKTTSEEIVDEARDGMNYREHAKFRADRRKYAPVIEPVHQAIAKRTAKTNIDKLEKVKEEVEPIEESRLPDGYRKNRIALSKESQKPEATKASLAGLQSSFASRQKKAALAKSQKAQPLAKPQTEEVDPTMNEEITNEDYRKDSADARGAGHNVRKAAASAGRTGSDVSAAAKQVTAMLLRGNRAISKRNAETKMAEELSPKEIMKKKSSGGSSSNDAAKTERKLGDAQNAAKRAAPGGADSPASINAARGIDRGKIKLAAIRAKHGK